MHVHVAVLALNIVASWECERISLDEYRQLAQALNPLRIIFNQVLIIH